MEFLKLWGSLIVAVVALVQPWVIAIWKRYLRPQRVDVYQTGTIEVGFSALGPTVGLQGTLRTQFRDAFVRSMSVRVIRLADHSEHLFQWRIFRSSSVSSDTAPSFEGCSSFLLAENSAFRYNIQFWESKAQEQARASLEKVRSSWGELGH